MFDTIYSIILNMAVKLAAEEQLNHLTTLKSAVLGTQKIAAIKEVRALAPGLGLAEAKKIVEDATTMCGWSEKAVETIQYAMRDYLDVVYTKEQFMALVSAAYDCSEDLFEDPLNSVLHALKNLQAKGGIKYAAMRDQKFIDSI
jgi:hypothetical protein